MRNSNKIHKENLTLGEKFALKLTNKIGTIGFFFIILIWTIVWLGWNILAPKNLQFDPFPAFVLWLFMSNMIQIFLMPLIMVGQNLQNKHNEIRAENDYEINVKSEKEIEQLHKKIDELFITIKLLKKE